MQLEIGMSTIRYFPASGTAGLLRSFVSGYKRLPAPPPMMIASVLSVTLLVLAIVRETYRMRWRLGKPDVSPARIFLFSHESREFLCQRERALRMVPGPEGHGLLGCASIAQLVEQLICNHQVVGSNPTAGSTPKSFMGDGLRWEARESLGNSGNTHCHLIATFFWRTGFGFSVRRVKRR